MADPDQLRAELEGIQSTINDVSPRSTSPTSTTTANDARIDMGDALPPLSPEVGLSTAQHARKASEEEQQTPTPHSGISSSSPSATQPPSRAELSSPPVQLPSATDPVDLISIRKSVHWEKELREKSEAARRSKDIEASEEHAEGLDELSRVRKEARRLVRKQTGRAPTNPLASTGEEAVADEDASPLASPRTEKTTRFGEPSSFREARRSSGDTRQGWIGGSPVVGMRTSNTSEARPWIRSRGSSISSMNSISGTSVTSQDSDMDDVIGFRGRRHGSRRGKGGVLMNLLKLYTPWGKEGDESDLEAQDRGGLASRRSLMGRSRPRRRSKRRRWSDHALFQADSRSSSRQSSRRNSMSSDTEAKPHNDEARRQQATTSPTDSPRPTTTFWEASGIPSPSREKSEGPLAPPNRPYRLSGSAASSRASSLTTLTLAETRSSPDLTPATSNDSQNSRRRRHLHPVKDRDYRRQRHEMKTDLNQPYLPTKGFGRSDPTQPALRLQMAQALKTIVAEVEERVAPGSVSERPVQGRYRSLAALIITTSGLAAAASPQLAHLAPASGPEAETNTGRRKVVMYSNPREEAAKRHVEQDMEDREEAEEMGMPREPKSLGDVAGETLGNVPLSEKADSHAVRHKYKRGKRAQKEIRITRHIADLMTREKFILDLAKSLVKFGAPTHSVEAWLDATALALEIDASFIYFPSVLIIAFHDVDVHSSSMSLVKPLGALDLYRLALVHGVYRKVVHDDISVAQGSRALRRICRETKPYHWSILLLAGGVASACASKVAFSGSFADICMSGALGIVIPSVQLFIVGRHSFATNIFEIGTAGVMAFIGRGLGGSGYFCYSSVISSSILLILPGWAICLGAIELGSRAFVPGAIRTVWAIIYTLFLSFALSIGAEIFDTTGVTQPSDMAVSSSGDTLSTLYLTGSFSSNNTSFDNTFQNGTITLTNGTTSDSSTVSCYRNPAYTSHWWYAEAPDWTLFILVPVLAFSLAIWNRADWRSRDMPVMIAVASIGYVVNFFLNEHLSDQADVVSAVAAFAIGVLGNVYSRVAGGSAFPCMVTGILLEVPNSIAAAGGLSISSSSDSSSSSSDSGESINSAVLVSIRLVQSGIGLAVGLFAAALFVYPFGKKGRFTFAF